MDVIWSRIGVVVCFFLLFGPAGQAQGLKRGDEVAAWEPIHIAGPHAGTKTCPVCTYLDAPVVLSFTKDVDAADKLVPTLENLAMTHAKGKLKVVLVVLDGTDDAIKALDKTHRVEALMLCRPDPARKAKQLQVYKIDQSLVNSAILYQDYVVKKTWKDLGKDSLAEVVAEAAVYLPKR